MGAGREVGSQDIGSREGRRESKYMKQERKEGVGTLATGKEGGSRDIGYREGRRESGHWLQERTHRS